MDDFRKACVLGDKKLADDVDMIVEIILRSNKILPQTKGETEKRKQAQEASRYKYPDES